MTTAATAAPSAELLELADAVGVDVEYVDVEGTRITAGTEALVAVLRALGIDIDRPGQAATALAHLRAEQEHRLVDAVHVAWDGEPVELRLGARAAKAHLTLRLEDGRSQVLDGPRLPAGLAPGYHELVVEIGGERATSRVISAPRRAHGGSHGRTWGVFAPLYAVRSEQGWGIGDLSDMRQLLEYVDEQGGGLVGSTPLLATYLAEPFEASPYSPVSRLFWNEQFVDLGRVPELREGVAGELAASAPVQRRRTQLQAMDLVNHREVYRLKRELLEAGLAQLTQTEGARYDAFRAWSLATPLVQRYAGFRAAVEAGRGRRPARDARLEHDSPAARYHQYAQWVMEEQLADLDDATRAGLYLDLPLGVHPDGFDLWQWQELFAPGVSVGAPPDPLGPTGQDWGLPPLHPQRVRESGYEYTIACMQHLFRHAATVRVDHVMGLHRLFWIPSELETRDGVYVRYAADEHWAIVCLESHRRGAQVVGEDLGTVPDAVRAAMVEHEVRRSYVMQFELDPDAEDVVRPAPAGSMATINTHDTPTWAAFWAQLDTPMRTGLLRHLDRCVSGLEGASPEAVEPQHVAAAALLVLAASDAGAVVANLEDAWAETEPQNVPGTTGEDSPNWRRRADRTVEEVRADDELRAIFAAVTEARSKEAPMATPTKQSARPTTSTAVAGTPTSVRHDVSLLTSDDVHLFNEGTHNQLHRVLGSHAHVTPEGVSGTYFAVWAPNAQTVAVIGDFNAWNDQESPLAAHAGSGIWEGFVPGVEPGANYKYRVVSRWGNYRADKADPFARYAEVAPRTGSLTWESQYAWGDDEWMAGRAERNSLAAPQSVYELHAGSWRRVPEEGDRHLTYRELAPELIEHVTRLGFTHVQFMPLMEHPFYGSWGYQTTGYFAPTSRYGTPDDLKYLVDQLHQAGIGVLLDWVPSHFPTDEHGIGYFDGTHLFEHADPRQGYHPDWTSYIFNYSRNEVRSFLLSSALYWLEEFHADGLRVDAVASMLYLDYSRKHDEWIPNVHGGRENLEAIDFLRRLNEDVYGRLPDAQTIAEESTAWGGVSRPTWTGGLGFGQKWDMGWMHDTLQYFGRETVHRRHHQGELTFRQVYAYTENFMLPLSHDEVVHGKGSLLARMPGDAWQQFANLRLLLTYMWTLPGKKLLFMGGEFGQGREWSHEASLDWHLLGEEPHAGIARLVGDLNATYRATPALHELDTQEQGFAWVDTSDSENSVFSYLRFAEGADAAPALVVLNATPVLRHDYRIGVPRGGHWRELLNSDAGQYWGGGAGNLGGVDATPVPIHGHEWSLNLTLPPLGAVILTPGGGA